MKWIIIFIGVLLCLAGCEKKTSILHSEKIQYSDSSPPSGMVFIKGNKFPMGSPLNSYYEARPVHDVKVSSFFMDTTEVTQKSFETLMGYNLSKHIGPDFPVEKVSWQHAVEYCNARSKRDGLDSIYAWDEGKKEWQIDFQKTGYRLPTEAEWEYACRAGTTSLCYWGDDLKKYDDYEWSEKNANGTTHAVATKKPNPWHLYDMLGNVEEWCSDWYQEDYYKISPTENPIGPLNPVDTMKHPGPFNIANLICWKNKSIRGCDFNSKNYCFNRAYFDPNSSTDDLGFRCVLSARADSLKK